MAIAAIARSLATRSPSSSYSLEASLPRIPTPASYPPLPFLSRVQDRSSRTGVVLSVKRKQRRRYISCERYFGFGCELVEETSNKLEGLPVALFVLPVSYVDAEFKDYGGELFINGEIVQRPPEKQRRVEPQLQRSCLTRCR